MRGAMIRLGDLPGPHHELTASIQEGEVKVLAEMFFGSDYSISLF
jgi:hypothetical protein